MNVKAHNILGIYRILQRSVEICLKLNLQISNLFFLFKMHKSYTNVNKYLYSVNCVQVIN